MTLNHPEIWRLDCYNLICFGTFDPPNEGIIQMPSGQASFKGERIFEFTSQYLVERYSGNIAALAELPTLVVAECSLTTRNPHFPVVPARFSHLRNIRQVGGDVIFDYRHISSRLTSQEVFTSIFPIPQHIRGLTENGRTHWAVKEGNLIEKLTALWDKRAVSEKPKVFGLDEWPLVKRNHIAVMMPYAPEFAPVYATIEGACAKVRCKPQRVDEIHGTNLVAKDIFTAIATSSLVICDITGRNPNVLYETGIAHAKNVDVVLITQNDADVPFDLRQIRYIRYSADVEGLAKLESDLVQTIQSALSAA